MKLKEAKKGVLTMNTGDGRGTYEDWLKGTKLRNLVEYSGRRGWFYCEAQSNSPYSKGRYFAALVPIDAVKVLK